MHVNYGVQDHMYPWVREYLIAALSETLGKEWAPALDEAWADVSGTFTTFAIQGK